MSVLGDKQRKFAVDSALLILYARALGYEIKFQPEHENHIEDSLHYLSLAKDYDLFKDEKYLTETIDHLPLGLFWESLGSDNTWGGRFGESEPGKGDGEDGNHYSIAHNGIW